MIIAGRINRLCGTTLGPWDVGQLDETTLDTIQMYYEELPQIRRGINQIETLKAQIRARHPQWKH